MSDTITKFASQTPLGITATTSLTKPNEAIAIRPKVGEITLIARKIYNVLLWHAHQQRRERGEDCPNTFTIALSILIRDAGFNSQNTELVKDILRAMQTTLVEWSTSEQDVHRWVSCQLLGEVMITSKGRGFPVTITYSYPDSIARSLMMPSRYTRIQLSAMTAMRSQAAAVLYELGCKYLTSPRGLTMSEPVSWWAAVLNGRPDPKEVEYRFFKRDQLTRALAELHSLQDQFTMELIEHREGRKVVNLQFKVTQSNQPGLGIPEEGIQFDLELVERLKRLGFTDAEASQLYVKNDEARLRSAVERVETRMKQPGTAPLAKPKAYLMTTLRNDAGSLTEDEGTVPAIPAPPKRRTTKALSLSDLTDRWRTMKRQEASAIFDQMQEGDRAQLLAEFEEEVVGTMIGVVATQWRSSGLNSRIVRAQFDGWHAKRLYGEPTIEDLEAFQAS